MKRITGVVAELSAYYWVLSVVSLVLGAPDAWNAFISFIIFLIFRSLNAFRVPVISLAISNASGSIFDFVDWADGLAIIRIRLRGGGGLRVSLSLSTLAFAATLVVALVRSPPTRLDFGALTILMALFIISTIFYRSSSTYIKTLGIAVSAFAAAAYATLVSLLVWLTMDRGGPLTIAALINFLAIIIGCDILTIKWAVLNSARTLIIGGLGLYDAVILVPTVSYLVSSLLIVALGYSL